jgi:hypothetical protein
MQLSASIGQVRSDLSFYGRTAYLLAKGLTTKLPGMQTLSRGPGPGGGGKTQSASYCYGVWLKHLALLWKNGMRSIPGTVVELGPGRSVGTGLAALLSGAERYIGIDAVRHADAHSQVSILRELTGLFRARAPRPTKGWPDYDDCLNARLFPGQILTEEHLARTLAPERLAMLERATSEVCKHAGAPVVYATWDDAPPIRDGETDLVFSHVVLCVVKDLDGMYGRIARWLKPGGWTSHQTDFSSLHTTPQWNGHLRYGERLWRRMAGRRPYFGNQDRLSRHLELLRAHGFDSISVIPYMRYDGVPRALLAKRWQALDEDDLHCAAAFIVARKRA